MRPIVTIVVPNYNGEKFIKRTVGSVLKNTQIPFELIVVDNDSKDKSLDILNKEFSKDKRLHVIKLKNNGGPTKAINIAVEKMQGKYLTVLGYDMEVDKGWLQRVVNYLDKNPDIGAGQLKILRMDRRNIFDSAGDKVTMFGFLAERAQEAEDKGQFDKVENIFSGKGTAAIFRKEVYKKAGGFDNDYFMVWEEPDLFWRIWKLGKRVVFLPMTRTWHAYGTKEKEITNEQVIMFTYFGCRNQLITILKNEVGFAGFKMLMAVILAWIGLLLSFLIKLDLKRAKAIISAFSYIAGSIRKIINKRKETITLIGKGYYLDHDWLPLVTDNRGIQWYIRKALANITKKPY